MIADEELQRTFKEATGNVMDKKSLDAFKIMAIAFECADGESYKEIQEDILASMDAMLEDGTGEGDAGRERLFRAVRKLKEIA